jgi:hypothetical protein
MAAGKARYEYPIWHPSGVPNSLALFVAMALHKGEGAFSFGDADFRTVARGVHSVVVNDSDEATTVTLRWYPGWSEPRGREPRHPAWLRADWRPPRWETVDSRDTLRLELAARVFASALARAVDESADQRKMAMFRRRFGLDGKPGWTLDAVGRSFGISESRVRHLLGQSVVEIHDHTRSRAPRPATDDCVQVVSIARSAIGDPGAGAAPVRLRKFAAAALPRVRPITGARLVVDLASIEDTLLEYRHRERLCSIAASLTPQACWPRPPGSPRPFDATRARRWP